MHVLPNGFHRIRDYGLLASGTKTETIARSRELIATVAPVQTAHQPQPADSAPATDQATHPCPCCGGRMITIETFKRGSTPHHRPTGPIIAGRIDTSSPRSLCSNNAVANLPIVGSRSAATKLPQTPRPASKPLPKPTQTTTGPN